MMRVSLGNGGALRLLVCGLMAHSKGSRGEDGPAAPDTFQRGRQ